MCVDAAGEKLGLDATIGRRTIRTEVSNRSRTVHRPTGNDLEPVGGGDQARSGRVGVVVVVAGGVTVVHAEGSRDVHRDGRDRGHSVKIFLRVPVDVAERGGLHIRPVGLDELQAGDVVVFLSRVFIRGVFGFGQDERGIISSAD